MGACERLRTFGGQQLNAADLDSLFGLGVPIVHAFVLDGEPIPWARARSGQGRYYTDPRVEAHGELLAWGWRNAAKLALYDVPLGLVAIFHRSTRRRVDIDNLLKLVMDAGTEASVWMDDSLVHRVFAEVVLASEPARTVVGLGLLGSR